jgi:dipeptidyl aminopeptidase/acylaminoacyl peptidase
MFLAWVCRAVAVSVLLLSLSAQVKAEAISPGDYVSLQADEGLVLFHLDMDTRYKRLELGRKGSVFSFSSLNDLEPGRYTRLLKLKAGEYAFSRLQLSAWQWNFDDVANAEFTIAPGKINYVGELRSRMAWPYASLIIENAALSARQELDRDFPGLAERYAWRYGGKFPDPFLERVRYQAKAADPIGETPLDSYVQDRDVAEIFFRKFSTDAFSLSPTGQYVVEALDEGANIALHLIDLKSNRKRTIYTGVAIESAFWAQDRILVISAHAPAMVTRILRVDSLDEIVEVPIRGANVLGVRPEKGEVVVMTNTQRGASLKVLDPSKPIDEKALKKAPRIGEGVAWVSSWWLDREGTPRLAELTREKLEEPRRFAYFSSGDNKWQRFKVEFEKNTEFSIAGFDDASRILVLTNRGRNFVELVRFDPLSQSLAETVISAPGADISHTVTGDNAHVIAVKYLSMGQERVLELNGQTRALYQAVERALPGRNLWIAPAARDGSRLVRASGPIDPGTIYLFNAETKKMDTLATMAPHLDGRPLASAKRFTTDNLGVEVESFLTAAEIPDGYKLPLLVLPHGGPFDVADFALFDPEVQYFARLGFAVLQVNFRGSGGRGKASAARGKKSWGTLMISDIEAAVEDAIKRYPIDAERVVAMGTSYGAYSAVLLALRNPARYKAAVGIGGVYDLPLLFSTGTSNLSERIVEHRRENLGDPVTELDELIAQSPVYQVASLKVPVLLLHDRGDEIATIEHAYRLVAVAAQNKVSVHLLTTHDNTHGLVEAGSAIAQYPKIARFLRDAIGFRP